MTVATGVSTAVVAVLFSLVAFVLSGAFFVGCIVGLVKLVRLITPDRARPVSAPTTRIAPHAAGARVAARARPQRRRPLTAPGVPVPSRVSGREELGAWRYQQLLALGLDPVTAAGATLAEIDIPELRALLARNCPAELALRILDREDG